MNKQNDKQPNQLQVLFYETAIEKSTIEVIYEEETFWLSQKKMASLFGVEVNTINYHLKEIFKSEELDKDAVIRKFRTTASDGKKYNTQFYNLDAIISVGYRVNSKQATQFRIWATQTLREYVIKGFVLDDARLKQGQQFGKDYFDELLERIREIRASERRFYQKITDIYAQCSIDYTPNSEATQSFYKTVQNKLHWAITGHTAAELITQRIDVENPSMGLTHWKNSPKGKILKSDVGVAKNYLNEAEIGALNRVVTMYLDYAENQAQRNIPMKMEDWIVKLDAFLVFNEYEVLKDAGKISNAIAKQIANETYVKFRIQQDLNFTSDFDKSLTKLKSNTKQK